MKVIQRTEFRRVPSRYPGLRTCIVILIHKHDWQKDLVAFVKEMVCGPSLVCATTGYYSPSTCKVRIFSQCALEWNPFLLSFFSGPLRIQRMADPWICRNKRQQWICVLFFISFHFISFSPVFNALLACLRILQSHSKYRNFLYSPASTCSLQEEDWGSDGLLTFLSKTFHQPSIVHLLVTPSSASHLALEQSQREGTGKMYRLSCMSEHQYIREFRAPGILG